MSESRFVTEPSRLRYLLAEEFVPWPLRHLPSLEANPALHDVNDPSTWGTGGGFVSDARFASSPTERVIKRANRNVTRAWRDRFGSLADSKAVR